MGEHGSCAVGGGGPGGVIVQISNEICATWGYNQDVVQPGGSGGVIVQEAKCHTLMCEFQMKFAQ